MNRRIVATIILIFSLSVALAAKKGFTLVIDAGHGGHDAGALGTFSKEKNINLNVALAFGRLVESNCPNVKVIYTRPMSLCRSTSVPTLPTETRLTFSSQSIPTPCQREQRPRDLKLILLV